MARSKRKRSNLEKKRAIINTRRRDMIDITGNMSIFRQLLHDSLPITKEICSLNRCPEQFLHNFAEVAWELLVDRMPYLRSKVGFDTIVETKDYQDLKRLLAPPDLKLFPYGRGADFYGQSRRVTYPDTKPTHRVVCLPKEGLTLFDRCQGEEFILIGDENFSFDCFGAWQLNDGGFEFVEMASPLDCLSCSVDGVERVVKAEECSYYLQEIVYDLEMRDFLNFSFFRKDE